MKVLHAWFLTALVILAGLGGCRPGPENADRKDQVRDIEGHSYPVIQIGEQLWMGKNLRTATFSDGTPVLQVRDYEDWSNLSQPAYCWYNNDSLNAGVFGGLYNYYAVESGKLCPDGWHVPSDEDWIELESFLGGAELAGGALKESGTDHWKTPNAQASNESGFTALPGGYRSYTGPFNLMRIETFWWTTSERNWYGSTNTVIYRNVQYDGQEVRRHVAEKANGFSVRCVKDPG
jgi:uncharacterized protein (TIGR02145 family)